LKYLIFIELNFIRYTFIHWLGKEQNIIPIKSKRGLKAINSINKGIKACVAIDIPVLMLSSFFNSLIGNEYEFRNFAFMLQYVCKTATANGLRIVFESILHIDRIIKLLNIMRKEFKIYYETFNPIRCGTGIPVEEIHRIRPDAIDHVHVKDAPKNMKDYCNLTEGEG